MELIRNKSDAKFIKISELVSNANMTNSQAASKLEPTIFETAPSQDVDERFINLAGDGGGGVGSSTSSSQLDVDYRLLNDDVVIINPTVTETTSSTLSSRKRPAAKNLERSKSRDEQQQPPPAKVHHSPRPKVIE